MAIVEIPTMIDASAYKFEIVLDNETYILQFSYIERIQRWILNILDSNENMLLAGITLHSSLDLIGRFKNPDLPKGTLICFDVEGENKSASRDDLGIRVKLLYDEVAI